MVSLIDIDSERFLRIETNLKYLIELDLTNIDENDPLSNAFYLFFLESYASQTINRTTLINWGRHFCYEVLAEGKTTKAKDSQITAAVLAYSALHHDRGFDEKKKQQIKENLSNVLLSNLDKDYLFFSRPNFTTIILYGLSSVEEEFKERENCLNSVINRYLSHETFNNLLGFPFIIRLLHLYEKKIELEKLLSRGFDRLKNASLEYDDQIYLLMGIWDHYYKNDKDYLLEIKPYIETVIDSTPILVSDIINEGDISNITVRNENRKISKLYKASFWGFLQKYKQSYITLLEKEKDKKYSRDLGFKKTLFFVYSAILLFPGFIGLWQLWPSYRKAIDFFISQNITHSWQEIIFGSLLLILLIYFTIAGMLSISITWDCFIKRKIISPTRFFEKLKNFNKPIAKWYWITVGISFLLVTIIRIFIQSPIQKKLGV